jgi:hypothetical protein
MMLQYYSNGCYAGSIASDYALFNTIAPMNLKLTNLTRAWVLETIRGTFPSENLKINPGTLICVQDRSRVTFLNNNESPTMFMRIGSIKWREVAYHIAEAYVHVYSCDTYNPIKQDICIVAIPTLWIAEECRLGVCMAPTIGQCPIGNDRALPPVRSWEKDRVVQPLRKQMVANLEKGGREAVEDWVSKHAMA